MLADDGLKPVAVVLTHGHIDHTFSVLPVCEGYDIPAYMHPEDNGFLDPGHWYRTALAPLVTGLRLPEPSEVPGLVAGDVLFAGSIGRVDLPGGSWEEMLRSLQDVILPLEDETVVLPGHGPATTI